MVRSFRVGVGILLAVSGVTAGLVAPSAAFAASATVAAAATPVNLIVDAGAERAKPTSGGGVVKVPGWTPSKGSMFTAVAYGDPDGFPGKKSPGPKNRGKAFFAGGPGGNTSGASQIESLAKYVTPISKGKATFKLSAWLGGFSSQEDYATVTVTWRTASGKALGHVTIGPVTAAQRKDVTGLLFRATKGKVPAGARKASVFLHMVRKAGEYVDGYADNLILTIAG